MNDKLFYKYIFQSFRVLVLRQGNLEDLTDELLVRAVTANENFKSLGYTLLPADIARLAVSPDLDTVCDYVYDMCDIIDVKPMYPDFPSQVMNIDEAEYRMHQLTHYFTTYGLMNLFGTRIRKGWLPDVEDTDKTVRDNRLLKSRNLQLISRGGEFDYVLSHVLGRRERMSAHDREAVVFILKNHFAQIDFSRLNVPFKQNLLDIFSISFSVLNGNEFENAMRQVCRHTGDVWKCTDYLLTVHRYHFKTSEKRRIVHLLESYPLNDFAENLILSRRKGNRIIKVLEYLSYNRFSTKPNFAECVRLLRNNDLKSWYSKYEALLVAKNPQLLDFVALRPGEMLRRLRVLLTVFSYEDVLGALLPKADKLSANTILSIMTSLSENDADTNVLSVCEKLLYTKLSHKDTELRNKKVFIDPEDAILSRSFYTGNKRGYLTGFYPTGMALRIPDEAKCVRFFVYWNHSDAADIDLHAFCLNRDKELVHIGWNGNFRYNGTVISGDVTHPNAAEYIDVSLNDTEIDKIFLNITAYYVDDCNRFNEVDTCFAGLMAVSELGTDVKLYNPDNCFFTHDLTKSECHSLRYGWIDPSNRCVMLLGEPGDATMQNIRDYYPSRYSLDYYLRNILLPAQNAVPVNNIADADITVSIGKKENSIDIVEKNFWLDV